MKIVLWSQTLAEKAGESLVNPPWWYSIVVFNCGIQLGLQPLTSPKLVQLV